MIKEITRCALITGAARRVGAVIAEHLHGAGFNVMVHYHQSAAEANALCERLNDLRPGSAHALAMDLSRLDGLTELARLTAQQWGGLDVLVNNASAFYPTAFGQTSEVQWDELHNANLKAPFFLSQAALPWLKQRHGCIVNITDIHATRCLAGYAAYSVSKAGLVSMTQCLAKELAPEVRVNAVAPGAILWPQTPTDEAKKTEILARIPLQRLGCPNDIAKAVLYLVRDAEYVTGQILTVDGGRGLFS